MEEVTEKTPCELTKYAREALEKVASALETMGLTVVWAASACDRKTATSVVRGYAGDVSAALGLALLLTNTLGDAIRSGESCEVVNAQTH